MNITKTKLLKLFFAVLICQLVGVIGSIFTIPAISTWYSTLNKPSFSPPNWIFGPAWILLYTLMGIAAYIIYQKGVKKKIVQEALGVFVIQLVLNSLWSIIFFGLRQPLLAFAEIVFLWLLIAVTIGKFHKLSKTAAYILLPYIAWVSFAAILNLAIVLLN